MGMIRRADLESVARQATVMDLSDLKARGDAIVADAQRQADQILAQARAERDRLIASARDEGLRAGQADGLKKGLAEGQKKGHDQARAEVAQGLAGLTAAWQAALDAFEAEREAFLQAARVEVVQLAAEIASRVTRRAVELDAGAVLPQMEAVLAAVARPSRLTVRVHPDDLALAKAELPGLTARFEQCRHAELVADPALARGSCVGTTEDGGRVDAGIASQLDRIIAELLGDEPGMRIQRPAHGDAA